MVQLKHYDSKIYGYKAEEFQFHNGTIKTPCAFLSFHISCKFQFHNGTIKTDQIAYVIAMVMIFQFHNGTIKTVRSKWRFNYFIYFNSIMVQLKPIDIYNGNLVFTEVSLRINVYFFAVKMSMYNESIFADLRQHLHLIFIVKG